jgi:hypothetical protein
LRYGTKGMNDSFGTLFVKYEALYRALDDLLSKASGPIDLTATVDTLNRHHPDVEVSPAELREVVLSAAQSAGIQVKLDGSGNCAGRATLVTGRAVRRRQAPSRDRMAS